MTYTVVKFSEIMERDIIVGQSKGFGHALTMAGRGKDKSARILHSDGRTWDYLGNLIKQ